MLLAVGGELAAASRAGQQSLGDVIADRAHGDIGGFRQVLDAEALRQSTWLALGVISRILAHGFVCDLAMSRLSCLILLLLSRPVMQRATLAWLWYITVTVT